MEDKLLILTQRTLSDEDGFYETKKFYYDFEKRKIFCLTREDNSLHNFYEKVSWTRELTDSEMKKFIEDYRNKYTQEIQDKITMIVRHSKISNIIYINRQRKHTSF